jgi:copper resistance protein D
MNLRVWAGGALVVVAASAVAWSLAYPQASPATALVRAIADCAAVATLGLAVVPALDSTRYRAELAKRATHTLAVASAAWLLTELARQLMAAAKTVAVPLARLSVSMVLQFTLHTTPGRAGLLSIAAAALVCLAALAAPRSPPVAVATAGVAATGIAARAVSGHLADSMLGAVAVAVHALAAAVWIGVLAALVVTVNHRGQWARVLPRFSQLALLCVAGLLVSGTVGALLVIDSPAELFASGYGRVLLGKIVLAAVLVALGWRNRTVWLPAVRSHRVSASVSRRTSLAELAIMVTALTLAAALVVTG